MADNPYPINVGKEAFSQAFRIFGTVFFFIIFYLIITVFPMFIQVIQLQKLNVTTSLIIILPTLVLFIFISAVSFFYNLLYLKKISYSVTNKEFILKGGIIARFERVLPYQRIQHAIITRSLMQRIFGLSTLVIQTGASNLAFNYSGNRNQNASLASPKIPGLNVKDAEKLNKYIIEQVLKTKSGQGI